jgi:GNAT superfamily N-acetyltransferase
MEEPTLADRGDAGRLARTFARAMLHDPMIRWPLLGDVDVARLEHMTGPLVDMYLDVSAAWLLQDGKAMAAWIPPEAASRFAALEQPTRRAIAPWTGDDGVRYGRFWDWLAAHVPDEPAWFLDLVAVDPSVQGRGLGTRLIRHGLELARSTSLPAFLETGQERNVSLYERFGFHVVARESAPDGGPTIWFMSTEP